jgi:hypothetical protein
MNKPVKRAHFVPKVYLKGFTYDETQSAYTIQGAELKIIYLLDGLDEISEDRADLILLQMLELSKKKNTHKIIVTCRSGNFNKIQLKNYFKNCIEFKVGQLVIKDIDSYFKAKGNADKQLAYDSLKLSNPKLISSIADVLGLLLLWDSIEQLNSDSTVLDLYELKVKRVLHDPNHYKDLPGLNLPNPKDEAILLLNEAISYEFHEKFQFLLPIHDFLIFFFFSPLQEVVDIEIRSLREHPQRSLGRRQGQDLVYREIFLYIYL